MKKIFFLAAMAAFISCSDDNDNQKITQGPVGEGPLSENFTAITAVHSDFQDISFIDREHGVATGTEGVVIKTDDGGATWTKLTTGTNISFSGVYMYDANTVFAARRDLYKWDGATNMTNLGNPLGLGGDISSMRFFDRQTGFAVQTGVIIKTTDGGNTWDVIYRREKENHLNGLYFVSRNVAYAYGGVTRDGGSGGQLLKTTDGGITWTDLQIENAQIVNLQFTDENTGFMTNAANTFFKTTDGGITWNKVGYISRVVGLTITSLLYVSDEQIFVTNTNGQLLKSANGGKDWRVIFEHNEENALTKITRVGRTLYVIGDKDLILRND